ncbi:hypothetical protein HNR42_002976 [Deinobacterium chartae]|uniref:Uncharacterized protein n=1 Tax=Deinobacterium chartae TaxID=521158 RepID=A0A841I3A1_9DEIO|nr:hypothetical protein [Deinobacterium chartae]MBB6099526.1 hypothetical protein [Deinobacterium chartae]
MTLAQLLFENRIQLSHIAQPGRVPDERVRTLLQRIYELSRHDQVRLMREVSRRLGVYCYVSPAGLWVVPHAFFSSEPDGTLRLPNRRGTGRSVPTYLPTARRSRYRYGEPRARRF